jgi:UDP-3-O-[3-hydroxymyristoyl] glucosamine N-acyltransferase
VSIGAYAVVGDGSCVGDGSVLHPHVVVYPRVRIGRRCTIHAGAVLREDVVLGDDVVLQPGVVVGGDGFGFLPAGRDVPIPIPQIGTVRLEDHVELGANTTVDRATVGETVLGRGVKLDNLVMVAHGCRIGEESLLAGQSGLAGSTVIGRRVQFGGQVGAAGHLEVGDDVRVAAKSGIDNDVAPGSVIGGYPEMDIRLWRRISAAVQRLPELLRRVRRLERALDDPGAAGRNGGD